MAIQEAARILLQGTTSHHSVVILSESVLQASKSLKESHISSLVSLLCQLQQSTKQTVLQWIPDHCQVEGNKRAVQSAKQGSNMPQLPVPVSYKEVKTMIKTAIRTQWKETHKNHNAKDPFHSLNRKSQVTILRLRTYAQVLQDWKHRGL